MGGRGLFELLQTFVAQHSARACVHTSLGQTLYLSVLAMSAGVVGNSSSGLIEAPAFGVGTVNIGSRQDGRLKAVSVIDCAPKREAISEALSVLLGPETRNRNSSKVHNPYGQGGAAEKAVAVIEEWEPRSGNKRFHDLNIISDQVQGVAL